MAGAISASTHEPINWAEKYIERLSRDMEELRGMESRLSLKIDDVNKSLTARIDDVNKSLTERIDTNNKQTQNIVIAMIVGLGAMTVAITIALRF